MADASFNASVTTACEAIELDDVVHAAVASYLYAASASAAANVVVYAMEDAARLDLQRLKENDGARSTGEAMLGPLLHPAYHVWYTNQP